MFHRDMEGITYVKFILFVIVCTTCIFEYKNVNLNYVKLLVSCTFYSLMHIFSIS